MGENLQTLVGSAGGSLGAPAPAGLQVQIQSGDPSKVLLSTSATTVGSDKITYTIATGTSSIPAFCVQALDGAETGAVTLTATANGYSNGMAAVTLQPSGFVSATYQTGFTTSVSSADTTLQVRSARLDPIFRNYQEAQGLRPGMAGVPVTILSDDTAIGTITVPTLTFNPGDTTKNTSFHPVASGTTIIRIAAAGFVSASNYNNLTANVNP